MKDLRDVDVQIALNQGDGGYDVLFCDEYPDGIAVTDGGTTDCNRSCRITLGLGDKAVRGLITVKQIRIISWKPEYNEIVREV